MRVPALANPSFLFLSREGQNDCPLQRPGGLLSGLRVYCCDWPSFEKCREFYKGTSFGLPVENQGT